MDLRHLSRLAAISTLLLIGVSSTISLPNPREKKYGGKELDELMARVWENCETNLDNLRNYVFNEREVWENNLIGRDRDLRDVTFPEDLKSFHREYVWIVRDGFLIRSPMSMNGIDISRKEQKAGEEEWIEDERNQTAWKSSMDLFIDFLRYCFEKYGRWCYYCPKCRPIEAECSPMIACPSACSELENDFKLPLSRGKYRYRGEKLFEGRRLLSIEFVPDPISMTNIPGVVDAAVNIGLMGGIYSTVPLSMEKPHLKMLIDPEEAQLIQLVCSVDNCGQEREYSMVMEEINGKVWLPKMFSATSEIKRPHKWIGKVHYSREFYSYSRGEVKARFWSEEVKTKIWYDMDNLQPK